MSHRASAALALGASGVAIAGAAATVALDVANHATIPSFDAFDPIGVVMPLTFAAVGGLVAVRHPRNAVGWLFLFMAVLEALLGTADQYARLALITRPGSLPGAQWALWFVYTTYGLVWPTGAAPLTLMLLPNGRLPTPRWRYLVALDILLTAVNVIFFAALVPGPLTVTDNGHPSVPNPTGLHALQGLGQGPVQLGVYFAALAVALASAGAPFLRMRRAAWEERQQLKWIAYAALVSAAAVASVSIAGSFLPSTTDNVLSTVVIVVGFGGALPLAAGIAIFKHGLYEIDIVISRTLVYAVLATLITGLYVGIAVGIGSLVGSGGKPNLGLSILATAIVAVGFQPVREQLQKVANRLVYGKRATPYEVLSEFSGRIAETYAATDVLPRMARLLQQGTGATSAAVWLRAGEQLRPAAAAPADGDGLLPLRIAADAVAGAAPVDRMVEVRHQGELLGALSITKRRGETLTPLEEKLVDDLAHQAGLVLKNVGLTTELLQRLDELRISRQRVVQAQDEERRRLERNLHDGAQQNLVAFKVKLGLVEMLTAKDPAKAVTMLEQLKGDADEALETLRDLARGIYPPMLAEKGLAVALESQARKATLPVTVDADHITRYPQDIEATVYFCVLEALQNVQKYANATQALVRLSESGGELRFEVEDDGVGFDVSGARHGSGLVNMADRLDALGGSLDVDSDAGKGTCVCGTVALAAAHPVLAAAGVAT